MEQRDYSREVPTEPPEGMIPWLMKKGKFQTHLLRYKAARVLEPLSGEWIPMVELKCSGCGGTMYAEKVNADGCGRGYASAPFGYHDPETHRDVICGNTVKCPMCGCTVRVYHTGSFRYGVTLEEVWPMTVTRLEDKLVLTGWYASQHINHDCEETIGVRHYEAYVVEEKKVVRLMGYMRCLSSVSFFNGWEQRKTCLDVWGEASLMFPWDPAILEGTTGENSKLHLYMKQAENPYPVTYLRVWQKHRNVENLVVQGCGFLLGEMICKGSARCSYQRTRGVPKLEDVNWKEVRPSRMLGLTREEFAFCRDMRWTPDTLGFYRDCLAKGVKLKLPEDLKDCVGAGLYWCSRLLKDGEPLMRSVRYLRKQKKLDKRVDATILQDYWNMARREGYELSDDHARYPKSLMREHDRLVRIRMERADAEKKKRLDAQNKEVQEKFAKRLKGLQQYAWEHGGILIRPCERPEELDAEGKALNHCVATYKDTHAKGKSAIFFVRRKAEPDQPWYTLQLDLKSLAVLQNRGKCNCAKTEAVELFEKIWLEHINSLKKEKKRGDVA